MEALLVSACLLGFDCKYNGGNNALPAETLQKLRARYRLIPICPELMGGLPVPRTTSERIGDRVIDRDGVDRTDAFRCGAARSLEDVRVYAAANGCRIAGAVLKANSPSCGVGTIYDGTFTGTKTTGDGVFTALLREEGIPVYTENDVGATAFYKK